MTDDKSVSIEMRRCPNCGASDVSTNTETGKLRCNYCKHDFDDAAANSDTPDKTFENAKGDIVSSGASNIIPGQDVIATFKCPSCGRSLQDSNVLLHSQCVAQTRRLIEISGEQIRIECFQSLSRPERWFFCLEAAGQNNCNGSQ